MKYVDETAATAGEGPGRRPGSGAAPEVRAMRILFPGRKVELRPGVFLTVFAAGIRHVEEFRHELIVLAALNKEKAPGEAKADAMAWLEATGRDSKQAAMRLIDCCVAWPEEVANLAGISVADLPAAKFEEVFAAWSAENAEAPGSLPLLVAVRTILNPFRAASDSTSATPSPSSSTPDSPSPSSATPASMGSPTAG